MPKNERKPDRKNEKKKERKPQKKRKRNEECEIPINLNIIWVLYIEGYWERQKEIKKK